MDGFSYRWIIKFTESLPGKRDSVLARPHRFAVMRFAQAMLLILVTGSLVTVGILCLGVHSPLSMKGGLQFVSEAVISLAIYGLAVLTVHRFVNPSRAYMIGFLTGIVSGIFQIVHMSLEMFGNHLGERTGITLMFMGLSFALWCAVAFWVIFWGGRTIEALFAAVFSAITTIIIAVSYGIFLSAAGYPDSSYVATWPEFVRSGWSDARSFAIANTFDAAMSHFVVAPIVGILVGGIGISIALAFRKAGLFKKSG